jgi:hypothetical protein
VENFNEKTDEADAGPLGVIYNKVLGMKNPASIEVILYIYT